MILEAEMTRPVRFPPDVLDHAEISFDTEGGGFVPALVGLLYDEAPLNGCAVVVLDDDRLQVDARCRVKAGRMAPLAARVAWRRLIEPRLVHIGVQYLE